jgi:uncharacterized protein with PQ loop repeat
MGSRKSYMAFDIRRYDRTYLIMAIGLVSLLLIFVSQPALGNITTYPSHVIINSYGKINATDNSPFLEEVNISINLYKDRIEGNGLYMLRNPSKSNVNMTLFFDPSYYPKQCKISINGNETPIWHDKLGITYYYNQWYAFRNSGSGDPYNVNLFEIKMKPFSYSIINIFWKSDSKTIFYEGTGGIFESGSIEKITLWGTSYLIISNSSWTKPIKTLKINFISHNKLFDDPKIYITKNRDFNRGLYDEFDLSQEKQINVSYLNNTGGHKEVKIIINNWQENDTLVTFRGKYETKDVNRLSLDMLICINIPLLVISLSIFNLFIHKRKINVIDKKDLNSIKNPLIISTTLLFILNILILFFLFNSRNDLFVFNYIWVLMVEILDILGFYYIFLLIRKNRINKEYSSLNTKNLTGGIYEKDSNSQD